ncbi:hypothetical protein EY643_09780 [Halioglobus maricola]|uniref:AAA family ATPase n=1 Tax=Halioglobus maricola TaxID=2601894 RepID=A0A5P9NKB7_9GAMM|nr:SbcC/MukB-like Walker B domain-containing protein [Halioglobus maricola]QFU75926.1 hypothetical protein EY643_09780 [Halioglobus maricola]
MFCKRIIYVNWGNIPNMECDFGPINLFSGGNGSGKTTAADGLQSLMTAAYENLYNYNPGQDETTQRGRGGKQVRTLASYVMGCDDGSYSRLRMTDGYIAGIFHPTQGESAEPFTAVMCVRAKLDESTSPKQARQEEIKFLIVPGHELSLDHFILEEKIGKTVVTFERVDQSLQIKLGKSAVEVYDKKGQYLRRLYGAFKGSSSAVSDREAKHAARTFSNFMAYKPVKSISEFVANQILEPKDISDDIRQVAELMKTIHGMEEETRTINDAIVNLDNALSSSESYIASWLDLCVTEYAEVARQNKVKQGDYLAAKDQQRNNEQSISEMQRDIEQSIEKRKHVHSQLVEFEAQRRGIDTLKTKDELDKSIEFIKGRLTGVAGPFLTQNQKFGKNHTAAKELSSKLKQTSLGVDIPYVDTAGFNRLLKQVIDGPADSNIDAQQLFTKDWVNIASLEHSLDEVVNLESTHNAFAAMLSDNERDGSTKNLRDQVLSLHGTKHGQMARVEEQVRSKEKEIQKLQGHTVSYPPHISAAVEAIEKQCPSAKPVVLCDYIEVSDPKWQMAIEGYMGGARFSILVEPDYEADAIRLVRSLKGRRNSAKIIQGRKAQNDAQRKCSEPGSILDVMTFTHKYAEYFVQASYGNLLRVSNENELKDQRRAVTPDGLGSGNYSMFRCDISDGELVFGQGARERALIAKNNELKQLSGQLELVSAEYHRVGRIKDLMDQVRPIHCTSMINEMLSLYRDLQAAEYQLESLDLSDFEELEERLEALNSEHEAIDQSIQALNKTLGNHQKESTTLKEKVERLADEKEKLEEEQGTKEELVVKAAQIYPSHDASQRLVHADAQAAQAGSDFDFSDVIERAKADLEKFDRDLYYQVSAHNQNSNSYNVIVFPENFGPKHDDTYFKKIVGLKTEIEVVNNILNNNVLVGKQEKLGELKESFNTAFVTNLCHSIYQAINDGRRLLDDLNSELDNHVFGTDKERFSFAYKWVPEFYDFYRFFKEIIEIPSLGDGTTLFDAELSDKSIEVRDRLMSMLLDKDTQFALRELERISDYRNYRHYEIYKTPENKEQIALSTYGTGSGGQLETPAYIIRSAAVTSAFKFNEGNAHCRMVLVDEAFSKMDETRSREVINYLTEALGLQLIFIMPTSKSGPFLDLISNQVVFSKCPSEEKIGELETQVLVDRKTCNKDKIKALWANHRKTVSQQVMLDFMEDVV